MHALDESPRPRRHACAWAAGFLGLLLLQGCGDPAPVPRPEPGADERRDRDVQEEKTKRLAAEGRLEETIRERDRLKRELEASRETSSANDAATRAATQLLLDRAARIKKLERENAALRGGEAPPADVATPGSATPPAVAGKNRFDVDRPVLVINGEAVSRREFVEAIFHTHGSTFVPIFVSRVLVDREAQRLGLEASELECEAWGETQLAYFEQKAGGPQNLEKRLAEQGGVTVDEFRAQVRFGARTAILLEKLAKHERETPEGKERFQQRVRDAYEESHGEKVTAKHIYVKLGPGSSPPEAAAAAKKAKAIHDRLMLGEKFEDLARTASDDQASRLGGGDLGAFSRAKYAQLPELNKVFFSLGAGDVSAPVKTDAGYHIVKVVKHDPPTKPFDAVREQITLQLEREGLSRSENDAILTRLRESAKVERKLVERNP